ncbi:Tkl protein kinase [Globisporangium polare]
MVAYFKPSTSSHARWTKTGLAHEPPWYLSLRDAAFSEAQEIGEDSFGAVYKGSWSNTLVVVELMGFEADAGTISTGLLLHEVRVWHRLNHPHVLRLYGACHVDKRYSVCEYAPNGDLSEFLE